MKLTLPSDEQIAAAEKLAYVDPGIVRAAMARVPPSWRYQQPYGASGGVFTRGTLQVIYAVARYDDGRVWYHVSVCGRRGRDAFYLPTFDELKRVKHDFLGDRWAYQVFPDEKHYVNQNPYVLHLYALMDSKDSALPDFTWGLGGI